MQCRTGDTRSSLALALAPSGSDVALVPVPSLQESAPRTVWPDWGADDSLADSSEEQHAGAARAELAALLAERDDLAAANAALVALADTSARVVALLSTHSLHAVAGPSSALGGCPATRAVAEVFRVGLQGVQPPEGAYAALARVPMDRYMDLEVDFRAGLGRALADWAAAPEVNERRRIQHALATAVAVREKVRWHIFTLCPEAALHYWSVTTATAEDVAARRAKQAAALAAMKLTPRQIHGVRRGWQTFCAGMRDLEATRKDAEGRVAGPLPCEAVVVSSLRARSEGAAAGAAGAATLADLPRRQMMAYDGLVSAVVAALTWAQAAMLAATMSPYSADFVELCNDILFMGPKRRS